MSAIGITSDGYHPTFGTMGEVFDYTWGQSFALYDKAKGAGTVGITTDGAMNAVYGPYVQNLTYNLHNTYAVLGQKPYKTGRRFQEGLSMGATDTAGVTRGGWARNPVFGNYVQIEMPYKTLAHRAAMNLGFSEIGNKNIDDVFSWEDFFKMEGETFAWAMNNDLLRRIEDSPISGIGSVPVGSSDTPSNEIVGYESLERIISNGTEGASLPEFNNVPWRLGSGIAIPSSGDQIAKYRDPNYAGYVANSNFDSYVDAQYTSGTTDGSATLRQLTLQMIDKLFLGVMPWWNMNSPADKVLITRYDTMEKIQTLLQPQQRYLGFEAAQVDVNGIKTVPGRDTGYMVSTYNQVPMISDYMVQGGYGTTAAGHAGEGVGRIYLIDKENIFNGTLRAMTVELSENPIVLQRYVRLADMNVLGEIQATKFRSSGKIVHLK